MQVTVAYFSAEFGVDENLPIYSGGLGVLAGDYIKAANDLALPTVGVGILYRKGNFEQRLEPDGRQIALYPDIDFTGSVNPVLDSMGNPVIVTVPMGERVVHLKIWCKQVGQVPIYLLDADLELNQESDRTLTDVLYGGGVENRICQEIILGIGGVRALRKLGIHPDIWHINEGHAAFLVLERLREYSSQGISFLTAVEAVKAETVFTTHTPVPAGHDVFEFELMDRYLGAYYWQIGATREQVLELGRIEDKFNMTRLALSMAAKVNGVSKIHAETSRDLFHGWMPEMLREDIPVEAITNGIHMPTWLAPEMKELFDRYFEPDWLKHEADPKVWDAIAQIPDEELWHKHLMAKGRMFNDLNLPVAKEILTVGFARRFATYKRALLIFSDLERLARIVNEQTAPMCIIFAGKAHPADIAGQELIRRIVEISRMERFHNRIFFVENYDMRIAADLVQGVDVWLNNPLKPLEASGTSGQKAAVNGVLNCSILDGWWAEGYNSYNGWAIERECNLQAKQEQSDSESLYEILEKEIVPSFYQCDGDGIPRKWVAMMKESIRSLAPVFNANRLVQEYWNRFYLPAAQRGKRFRENNFEIAGRVADYKKFIRAHWPEVRVESFTKNFDGANQEFTITAKILLGPIWFKDVRVEAVGTIGFQDIEKLVMTCEGEIAPGLYRYKGNMPNSIDLKNIRVVPISPDFANDFELEIIRWG